MALPLAEIEGKPWYETTGGRWAGLGASAQAYLIGAIVWISFWVVVALSPLYLGGRVALCGRAARTVFPKSELFLGESVVTVVFLVPVAFALVQARRSANFWAG
ncbi:MAG: hypothetical protein L3K00_07365 [Thermoplasmata archaeon]|nr:hypothetical protein [Thermoplasmata archaeon]